MQEPRCENSRFIGTFRSVGASVERFPKGCAENEAAFEGLAKIVDGLQYEGYILSPSNSYQVGLTFDHRIVEQVRLLQRQCTSEPLLKAPREIAQAVGRNADLLLQVPETGGMIVVEIEKANKEKILRDIVKMLLFLDGGQADLAALICPRNYAHAGGVWRVFDTAHQVLQSFIRVTELSDSKAKRLALIGFTQEVFLNGAWVHWNTETRLTFQKLARPYFEKT